MSGFGEPAEFGDNATGEDSGTFDPYLPSRVKFCCDAQQCFGSTCGKV
jgi:hypothetical protein